MTHSAATPAHHTGYISESLVIWIAGLIQFVNILDFMMVMPLGPDFGRALGIPLDDIGIIGGVYTFAAGLSGLVASLFIDRIGRKKAILFSLIGLTLATYAGALVWNKEGMITARVIAGCFGGPLTALVQALIADHIAPERRGRAMGKIAGAFAAASVLGVPFGLELSSRFSWHMPFIVTGTLALLVTVMTFVILPSQKALSTDTSLRARLRHVFSMLHAPTACLSYITVYLIMTSGFMIIPNIAAHFQLNLHYPRENMGILYMCGGAVSFFSMRFAGQLVDRHTSFFTAGLFTILLAMVLNEGFILYPTPIPTLAIFTLCMVALSGRMVATQTLASKVPAPAERGAFMSIQSTVMNLGSATGAYYSSLILKEQGDALFGMPTVGLTSIGLSIIVLVLMWQVEKRVIQRDAAIAAS